MIDDIVRKLALELRETIMTERQVVYILVQMRKILDRQAETANAPSYPSLRFYGNWVVHVGLTNSLAKEIVKKANDFFPRLVAESLTAEEKEDFRRQYTFASLRSDMDRLIADNGLPGFTATNWNCFVAYLLPVLEDCPLSFKSTIAPLAEVDEVILRSEVSVEDGQLDGGPPRIVWGFFKNGKERCWLTSN